MLTLSLSILALSLSTAADARALSKRSITWNECAELNKNISILTEGAGPFESFECGTLEVPLDYTEDDSPKLNLDLFRNKATKEPSLGTVLFNPGGPGGDAPTSLARTASDLRAVVGDEYDIVSWDPRGTGNTIPFNCTLPLGSANPSTKRDLGKLPTANLTEIFLDSAWDAAGQFAEICYAANNETGRLIGTPFVARDMLEIVDALGEDGMLRYYGISYGTVLGSYFATMFPDRVESMVLDGNLDPADYRNGTWGDSVIDADKVLEAFLNACVDNKEECALAKFLDTDSAQVLFDALSASIAPYAKNATDASTLLTLIGAKNIVFGDLYYPAKWPRLAETLVAALNMTEDSQPEEPSNSTQETPWTYGKAVLPIFGIRGSDATYKPKTAEEYLPEVARQASISDFADRWYFSAWVSARWKLPAKEQFTGKFTAKTKNPILYVNGESDPVTPLRDAVRASKGFEGSVLLAHSGFGHTSLADPSTCVQKHTQAYFKDGTLPEDGTVCEPDLGPWELAKARNGAAFGALNTAATES